MAKGRAPKGRGKTVKDYKRGKAADDYDVEAEGDAGEGHNSRFEPSGEALNDYLSVIDEEDAEIAAIQQQARLKCQGPRASITKATKRMVKDGYHAKELATLVRKHRMKRKLAGIAHNLDEDQLPFFQSLEKALGDFVDTPLGAAAAQRELQPAE